MPGRKKSRVAQRKKSRAKSVTLHDSRLGKSAYRAHVGFARCLSELEVPTSPIPSAQPTAPPLIRRKRPSRPLSGFKHPPKKKIALDLAQACDKVFADHSIPSDEADLPLIQSAVLKSKNGSSMLARLILPADQSETSLIRLPAPIEVEPKDAQVCLQKLVKLNPFPRQSSMRSASCSLTFLAANRFASLV